MPYVPSQKVHKTNRFERRKNAYKGLKNDYKYKFDNRTALLLSKSEMNGVKRKILMS